MGPLKVEIVTPDKAFPIRDVDSLDVPAETGRLTVLKGHAPLVCALAKGDMRMGSTGAPDETWSIGPGIMTVASDTVTVLTESAACPERMPGTGDGAQK